MTTLLEIGKRFKEKVVAQYPAIDPLDIPVDYTLISIEYKKSAIEEYDVVFWHRLLRILYDEPIEIECEIRDNTSQPGTDVRRAYLQKTQQKDRWDAIGINETTAVEIQAGKIRPFPINWKYLIRLPSGGLVELGTKDNNTAFYVAAVTFPEHSARYDSQETEKFVRLLLEEANRVKGQLFNPIKEFERREGVRLYLLFNVYLSNYLSAKYISGMAETLEAELTQEFMRYDARTSDLYDEEKRGHIDRHMLTCGMHYCTAISNFFMAFEGFVNIVFHAFLKNKFRDKEFRIDQRFDLEQKLRLMSVLCDGFNENSELPADILTGFKKLKNYRNSLFHSKVEDSLKSLCFVEDGFLYNYDMDRYKERFLPAQKIKLTTADVTEANDLVDEIINYILESMHQDTRNITEKYILKEPHIPIVVLESGDLRVGKINP